MNTQNEILTTLREIREEKEIGVLKTKTFAGCAQALRELATLPEVVQAGIAPQVQRLAQISMRLHQQQKSGAPGPFLPRRAGAAYETKHVALHTQDAF